MFRHYMEGGRPARLFARGDIKYVILDLLKDKPSHGYEIIRALENRFHGLYSPSAGSIYPTLQMLEEMGYLVSAERDGKKVFSVTPEGQRFLTEHRDILHRLRDNMNLWRGEMGNSDIRELLDDLRSMTRLIGRESRKLRPDQVQKVSKVISQAYRDIERILEKGTDEA